MACGALYVFGADLVLRPAPPALWASLAEDDRAEIARVRAAIRRLGLRRPD